MARPKPTGWKARATWHGLSSPCRGGGRRVGRKEAQKAQKSECLTEATELGHGGGANGRPRWGMALASCLTISLNRRSVGLCQRRRCSSNCQRTSNSQWV